MTGKCFASMIEEHRELYFHLRRVQSKCKYLCMQTMVRAVPRVELLLGFIRWASAKFDINWLAIGLHEDDVTCAWEKKLGHAICSFISGIFK